MNVCLYQPEADMPVSVLAVSPVRPLFAIRWTEEEWERWALLKMLQQHRRAWKVRNDVDGREYDCRPALLYRTLDEWGFEIVPLNKRDDEPPPVVVFVEGESPEDFAARVLPTIVKTTLEELPASMTKNKDRALKRHKMRLEDGQLKEKP